MTDDSTDKMEILPTRPQNLSLEARHTISLEVAKQRRLRVATSLFLPKKSSKQIPVMQPGTSSPSHPAENHQFYPNTSTSNSTASDPRVTNCPAENHQFHSTNPTSNGTASNPGITNCPAENHQFYSTNPTSNSTASNPGITNCPAENHQFYSNTSTSNGTASNLRVTNCPAENHQFHSTNPTSNSTASNPGIINCRAENHQFCSTNTTSNSTVSNPGIKVITNYPEPNAMCSKHQNIKLPIRYTKSDENTPKKRATTKKAPKTTPAARRKKSQMTNDKPPFDYNNKLPMISIANTMPSQPAMEYPPNFLDFQYPTNHVIDISSDEDDTKMFMGHNQRHLLRRWPESTIRNSEDPVPAIPVQDIPMQNPPVRNSSPQNVPPMHYRHNMCAGFHQPQHQQYASAQSFYNPPTGYPPSQHYIPGYHPLPVNYQPGFYTESYPNTYRQPGMPVQNHIPPDIRYRPYQDFQKSPNTYRPQAQPVPELSAPLNQSALNYPQADLSKWLPPRRRKPVNHAPPPGHQPAQQALLTANYLHSFYERIQEICQSNNEFWSQDAKASAIDYAMSMMLRHEPGNNWIPPQALMNKRMENNAGNLNCIMQQPSQPNQHPPSPRAHPDSTTGLNQPSSARRMFIPNMPPHNSRLQPNYPNFYNLDPKVSNSRNNSTISPRLGQLSLNDDMPPEGFYLNLMNLPEYDPRDNR